jgi:hypothetical protein
MNHYEMFSSKSPGKRFPPLNDISFNEIQVRLPKKKNMDVEEYHFESI